MRTTKIMSLSLPPELLREAERVAKKEGRTKSELFREALRRYIQEERWHELQRYGMRQAKKLGLKEPTADNFITEEYQGDKAALRKQLKEGAIRRAKRDLHLAGEWFSLEEEVWPKNKE